jgi:hypothetical protein
MLDNLRDDATSKPFYEDEAQFQPAAGMAAPRRSSARLLGMTAQQRFLIAVLLMLAVCSLGAMCLLVTGKIGL